MVKYFGTKDGFEELNRLGAEGEDFLFIISFDKSRIFAESLSKLPPQILYKVSNWQNFQNIDSLLPKKPEFRAKPVDFEKYSEAIKKVKSRIQKGDTYLLNLTFPTPIESNLTPKEIFLHSEAPYKLLIEDSFVCFSPESFIKIENNQISTYPMKGTIDASIPDAKEIILQDSKEMAEHTMIVDLMRNDLNIVATQTKVEKFRYIQQIKAGSRELIQVSSKISAKLPKNWRESIGTILEKLTPAGSISGTPKKKTLEIIDEVESYERGFYSGVFGVCRGDILESAVMIRFIESGNSSLIYKSGGGITIDSQNQKEYQELIDKVYIPI